MSVGRGLPGGNSLFFVSPKKSKQKKGDPAVCDPSSLTLRGATCGARSSRGRARTRFAQTIARPDPSGPPLLGAYRRVEKKQTPNTRSEFNPESLKRVALQGRESQGAVMFARERSARGHMRLPSLAQRGEGRAGGWEWGVLTTAPGEPRTRRDASAERLEVQASALALSASVVNESAKNSSSGRPPAAVYSARAESTTMGAPQA